MRVEFFVVHEGKRISGWTADRGKGRIVPGSTMAYGDGVPHDLVQFVVEAATGYRNGFWDLIAKGATFKSTGRRRTRPGRAVIAQHRAELDGAERVAGVQVAAWRAGERTSVTAHLAAADAQWRSLRPGQAVVFEWPSPVGAVVDHAGMTHDRAVADG